MINIQHTDDNMITEQWDIDGDSFTVPYDGLYCIHILTDDISMSSYSMSYPLNQDEIINKDSPYIFLVGNIISIRVQGRHLKLPEYTKTPLWKVLNE